MKCVSLFACHTCVDWPHFFCYRVELNSGSIPSLKPALVLKTVFSGPASIVYNERGHRADEEEPDIFPEDDTGPTTSPRSRLRSEPVSRALTPTDKYFSSVNTEHSRRGLAIEPPKAEPAPVDIPEVARERPLSTPKGLNTFSTPFSTDATRDMSRSLGIEQEQSKGKAKTPKATPKSTPKLGDTLNSVWGSYPLTNPPSPIPPSPAINEPEPPQLASSAQTPKKKDGKKSLDAPSSKTSPSIPANRSPLGKSEPIVEQAAETPAGPVAETVVKPAAETPAEPVAETPAKPVAETSTEPVTEPLPATPAASSAPAPVETPAKPVVEITAETPAQPVAETSTEPVAEQPVATPAASSTPAPSPASHLTSPTTSKKKKKGAAKGTSLAVDTKTAPSSSLPSAAATPNVKSAGTQLIDTGLTLLTEAKKPDPVSETVETTGPVTKSLSNVLSPVDLPDTTVNVGTVPATVDANLPSDAPAGDSLLSAPKGSSLFGSSVWDNTTDTANAEITSGFGWDSSAKTSKTPKIGASPWGKSPATLGGFGFGSTGSGAASPKPPSITPTKSPWAASWGMSATKSLDTKPAESLELNTLGESSELGGSSKSATQEQIEGAAPAGSEPAAAATEFGGSSETPATELSIPQNTSSKPSPKPTPKPAVGSLLLGTAEETPVTATELAGEPTAEDPVWTSQKPSPKPKVSAIEETTKPKDESTNEIKEVDEVPAAQSMPETPPEPKTPADVTSPTAQNGDGEGDGEEEKDEKEDEKDTKAGNKKGKKKKKGKK